MRKNWTQDQDDVVRNHRPAEAAELLGRTLASVEGRRRRISQVKTRHYRGRGKLWTKSEDLRLGRYRQEGLPRLSKRFKRHSRDAVKTRLLALYGKQRATPVHWTAREDKLLKQLWPAAAKKVLIEVLKRHTWDAMVQHAYRCKIRRIIPLKACENSLIEQLRCRAREDGIALARIGSDIGCPTYFLTNRAARKVDMNRIARAVEFFGGRLVIDWQDE